MIICEKCSKENQDHYKFCLGCGAELPRKDAPKPFSPRTPPHGVPAMKAAPGPAPVGAPPPAAPPPAAPNPMLGTMLVSPAAAAAVAPPAGAPAPGAPPPAVPRPAPAPASVPRPEAKGAAEIVDCPQCGHKNPTTNRFCASCGYNLATAARMMPPAPPPAAAPQVAANVGPVRLVALRADGSEAGSYDLPDAQNVVVGRDTGSIFAGDSYLSPRHASFTRRGSDVLVKDEGSLNGVYVKLKPNDPQSLEYDDVFRIGQEIIRFEELKGQAPSPDGVQRFGSPAKGYIGRLALVIGRDTTGNAFPIPERGLHCGRERGDVLFSEDGYVSGLHCHVGTGPDGRIYLTDVGSSNGTFLRIGSERKLQSGDILLMGQQLFRVDF